MLLAFVEQFLIKKQTPAFTFASATEFSAWSILVSAYHVVHCLVKSSEAKLHSHDGVSGLIEFHSSYFSSCLLVKGYLSMPSG